LPDVACRAHRLSGSPAGHDQEELLTPEPSEDVVASDGLLDDLRQQLQRLIAGDVSVEVVVILEVVDVEQEHRHSAAGLTRFVYQLAEPKLERPLVVDVG
jgi:hypothetical protein